MSAIHRSIIKCGSNAWRELQTDPDKLENYDNAGVACDRLHRGDEAIRWMEKKNQRLEAIKVSGQIPTDNYNEHRYRYVANIGMFATIESLSAFNIGDFK